MSKRTSNLPIVLVVSCAHAMVHLIEQSFASVEQVVSAEFALTTQQSGALGSALRIPFGFGAVLTGILADRMGASRVLSLYLGGIALVCASFVATNSSSILWAQMFLLGIFASMYHPAGLSLLSSVTTPNDRAKALGLHGVFGSLGLAAAPFLALGILWFPGSNWRTFFLVLAAVTGVLVFLFRAGMARFGDSNAPSNSAAMRTVDGTAGSVAATLETAPAKLIVWPFSVLMLSSAFSGIVYGGFLHFLTRYLSESDAFDSWSIGRDELARGQTAMVLFCGVGGQWLSGHLATPRRLPMMLSMVYLTNVPLLWWMSIASGWVSLVPCCLLAFVHFMNQPVYNSLLPDYVPVKTRSTWFGVSQMMTFGVGSVGPYLVGSFTDYRQGYLALAGMSLLAGLLPILIWVERRNRNF